MAAAFVKPSAALHITTQLTALQARMTTHTHTEADGLETTRCRSLTAQIIDVRQRMRSEQLAALSNSVARVLLRTPSDISGCWWEPTTGQTK